ncbi:MAG: Rho termination factor N-terminal domain-containing protein [Planctomycetota bacterium]
MPLLKTKKNKSMTMPQIQKKAKNLGITPGKMKKAELIHSIQMAENCTPCYGTSDGNCQYTDCCFMADCFKN